MHSESGSLLFEDDKNLRYAIKCVDQNCLLECGADKGVKWIFTTPSEPWRNGCYNVLIKQTLRF